MKQIRPIFLLIFSAALLVTLASSQLLIGTAQLAPTTVLAILAGKLLPIASLLPPHTPAQDTIVWVLRWQRTALAIWVGSGLAVSGACFQSLFRNPLADPFVLGVSSGAALGAAMAIVLGLAGLTLGFAFGGAAISLTLVWLVSQHGWQLRSSQSLLLGGVACGAFFNALMSSIMAMFSQQMQTIMFWLLGSLTRYEANLTWMSLSVTLCLSIALFYARDLDALILGEEEAAYLGIDVPRLRLTLLLTATALTSICVSVSGIIGFIGLIVPHLVRRIAGAEHWLLLPLSALWGGIFLLLSDGMTRIVPLLSGVPVGVVTALVGGPFFLYVLYINQREEEDGDAA